MAGHDLLPGEAANGPSSDRPGSDLVLDLLLHRHPHAQVAAISELAMVVPMPPSVPVPPDQVLHLASTLDIIVPADRIVTVGLFARARIAGTASAPVRRSDDPEHPVSLYLIDARRAHGVMLALFGDRLDDDAVGLADMAGTDLPPRVARVHKDSSSVFTWVDDAFPRILGRTAEEIVGRRSLELVHPDDHDVAIANWIDMLGTSGTGRRVRLRHLRGDGGVVWLEITNHNHLEDNGSGHVVAEVVDITDEMAAHAALEDRERLLHQLAETVPLGLAHLDPNGTILFANERLHQILASAPASQMVDLFSNVLEEDRPPLLAAVAATTAGADGEDVEVRINLDATGCDGIPLTGAGLRYCAARFRALHGGDGGTTGVIGCFEDITASVMLRRELEIQAAYDPLTECRNRASTLQALQTALRRGHRRRGTGTAVVFIDLDRFKPVNDRLGHAAGDQLLTVVARRLQDSVRADDIVGRIGGDEFLVVCTNVRRALDATKIAETIGKRLCEDAPVAGGTVTVAASIGVAWTDDPGADAEAMVAAADAAMYRSKSAGRCVPELADDPFGSPSPRALA